MEEKKELTLKERFTIYNQELKEKYHDEIVAIAEKNGVDMGVAFDMLRAVARGGNYAEGIELDMESLKQDYEVYATLAEELCKAEGLL